MKNISRLSVLTLIAVGLTACVTRAEIEELKKGQKDILAKLDKVAAKAPAARKPSGPRPGQPDPAKTYAMPVGDSSFTGSKDAWVTIVEVSDFQCPYCKRVGPTMTSIKEKYGKDVRIAFKHNPLPFHNRAMPAANAAECAGEQGKFWEMHDQLFENQRALNDGDIDGYAKKIGVDKGRFDSCFKANKYKTRIENHQKEAASLGARGTPAFFVNGRFISGAQPLPNFVRVIDEELKKAKASGIPAADYYKKAVMGKGLKKI